MIWWCSSASYPGTHRPRAREVGIVNRMGIGIGTEEWIGIEIWHMERHAYFNIRTSINSEGLSEIDLAQGPTSESGMGPCEAEGRA